MKLKNANRSILVLASLIFLSFALFVLAQNSSEETKNVFADYDQDGLTNGEEKAFGTDPRNPDTDGDGYGDGAEVSSGYNPTISAPGDKIISLEVAGEYDEKNISNETQESSLTKQVAEEISQVISETDPEQQQLSMDNIQEKIEAIVSQQDYQSDIPLIARDDIKIQEQNYGKYDKKEAQEKRKNDFVDYLIAIYYILSSNSPQPITTASDLGNVVNNFSQTVIAAVSSGNSSSLSELAKSGEKILEQMKEMEVPEDLVELHLQALNFAQYASLLENDLNAKKDDPLGDIARLSKIQSFIGAVSNFSLQVEAKFLEYGITYDESIKEKLKEAGLLAPEEKDLPTSSSEK